MKSGDTSTHRPQAVNLADFKAQATGIARSDPGRIAHHRPCRAGTARCQRRAGAGQPGLPDQGQRRLPRVGPT